MFLRLCVVVSLSLSIAVEGQVDYSKCSTLVEETKTCVKDHPINGLTENSVASQILNIFSANSTICSVKDDYIKLVECVSQVIFKCIGEEKRDLFASVESYKSSLNYFCDKRSEIVPSCVLTLITMQSYRDCLTDNAVSLPTSEDYGSLKEYVCKLSEVTFDCSSGVTSSNECASTKSVLLEMMKLEKPPACGANGLTAGCLLVLLTFLLSVMRFAEY